MKKSIDTREFHKQRYAEKIVMEDLRWFRIKPCLGWIDIERKRKGQPLNILDIGCGDGTLSKMFIRDDNIIYGVDIVADFVKKAKKNNIKAKVGDVSKNKIPFQTNSMDIIYAGALIEHLYDVEFFLKECKRVLKKGGLVMFSAPNIGSLTSRIKMLFTGEPKFYAPVLSWKYGGHIRIFNKPYLIRALDENGFTTEKLVSNVISFIPTEKTIKPWSHTLGRIFPSFGEVLVIKGRKR